MANTKAKLAWSVQVAPGVLAAHLDAYAQLHQREIKGLRLCHRFGQGPKAAITRLPVELVANIEEHLMCAVRTDQTRTAYRRDFKCWEGTCKPHEHLDKFVCANTLLELQHYECANCGCDINDDPGQECECGNCLDLVHPPSHQDLHELDAHYLSVDGGVDCSSEWRQNHLSNAKGWRELISGKRAVGHCGIFEKYRGLMLHDFGLHIWSSHEQIDDQQGRKNGRIEFEDRYCSTQTYLMLPSPGSAFEVASAYGHRIEGTAAHYPEQFMRAGSESCIATPVSMPTMISKRDIAAFGRAFKLLGLQSPRAVESLQTLSGSVGDAVTSPRLTEGKDSTTSYEVDEDSIPRLRLLIKTRLEREWA